MCTRPTVYVVIHKLSSPICYCIPLHTSPTWRGMSFRRPSIPTPPHTVPPPHTLSHNTPHLPHLAVHELPAAEQLVQLLVLGLLEADLVVDHLGESWAQLRGVTFILPRAERGDSLIPHVSNKDSLIAPHTPIPLINGALHLFPA